jgi:hypothetical protein
MPAGLNNYLAVKFDDYQRCIDELEHSFRLDDVVGEIRIHHLKCDGNGRPMVKALAELLFEYIIHYCISLKNRPETLTPQQAARLTKEARKLFRHPKISEDDEDQTGEAGETLLFFLTEAIIQAPQIVAKMELKTNHSDEVKGSDGIHAKWHANDKVVDFYFGESKLYKSVSAAISSALKSINDFHEKEMYKHELSMVTKHFKYADSAIKLELENLIYGGEPSAGARLNHICLIGFDWPRYSTLSSNEIMKSIKSILNEDCENIVENLNSKFKSFDKKHLRFEVFLIPFPSVSAFRREFNAALD